MRKTLAKTWLPEVKAAAALDTHAWLPKAIVCSRA
jgi:hypothetical protein